MARGINKVILVGYLGAEPDMRRSSQDTPICNISLATTEGWRDVNGQVQTRTEWHRCVFFKHLAEVVAQFLHKGSLVYVEGRLSTRKWVDQQNVTHYTTEIIGTEMQMLSSIRQQGGGEFSGASSGDDYSQQGGGDDFGGAPQQGGYGQGSGQSGYGRPQGGYSPYSAPAGGAPKSAPEPAPMAGPAPSAAAKPQAQKVSEPMPKEPPMDDLDNIDNEDVPF